MNETMLFVDDDPNLLQGLQRMLRSKRHEWDMTFVSSPLLALKEMERRCFDVVVTDMRMPEMDGAELLSKVKVICSKSVRIILSGQADVDIIMRAITSTHQYLSKPCDPELLKATIEKASRLRRLMKNEELEEFISQLKCLPAQPENLAILKDELTKDNPSIQQIGMAIAGDIGLSTKVIQLTSSSFFGSKRETVSAKEAVGILGVELLRTLCLEHNVFTESVTGSIGALDLRMLHKRGQCVIDRAQSLAVDAKIENLSCDISSAIGLMCRAGCIVLSLFSPEKYAEVVKLGIESKESIKKELELFGVSHADVGAYLLGLWGLPDPVIEAAQRHHELNGDNWAENSLLGCIQKAESEIQ